MNYYKNLSEFNQAMGFPPPEHPLLALYKCNGSCNTPRIEYTSDFYIIGFKKIRSGAMLYGKTKYDHDRGTMSFVKPRQRIALVDVEMEQKGFMICFHEDFLNGHTLHNEIKK